METIQPTTYKKFCGYLRLTQTPLPIIGALYNSELILIVSFRNIFEKHRSEYFFRFLNLYHFHEFP